MKSIEPIESVKEAIKEAVVDLVEDTFPKGQCEERGKAIVLSAQFVILMDKVINKFATEMNRIHSRILDTENECNETIRKIKDELRLIILEDVPHEYQSRLLSIIDNK